MACTRFASFDLQASKDLTLGAMMSVSKASCS